MNAKSNWFMRGWKYRRYILIGLSIMFLSLTLLIFSRFLANLMLWLGFGLVVVILFKQLIDVWKSHKKD